MTARPKILVTDTLFIHQEHVDALERAGYEVERLNKLKASEDELCTALADKTGYILGGIESVTERVINSATNLKAIAFTGSGYAEFIPAHREASMRGIAISAAVGANAEAVAEFSITAILTMLRQTVRLTSKGGGDFYIAPAFADVVVGVIGYGAIGARVARLCESLGLKVLCHSRTSLRLEEDGRTNIPLDDLLRSSDIVSVHVSKANGTGVLSPEKLRLLQLGSSVVNCAFSHAIDKNELAARLKSKELSAFLDNATFSEVELAMFPIGTVVQTNGQTAFNTERSNKLVSDRVTASLLNILNKRPDKDLVNPDYRNDYPHNVIEPN
jgi:phosphoglycerate dehydrogenase-like enzyme